MSEKKSSQRRIEASRANGATSSGPVTPEGKQIASRNALQHGLTAAKHVLLSHEDRAEFERFHMDAIDHFQPRSAWEQRQVHLMTNFEWNLRRALAVESAAIDYALLEHEDLFKQSYKSAPMPFRTWHALKVQLARSPSMPLFHRYRHSLGSQFHAAFLRLRDALKEPLEDLDDPDQPSLDQDSAGPGMLTGGARNAGTPPGRKAA